MQNRTIDTQLIKDGLLEKDIQLQIPKELLLSYITDELQQRSKTAKIAGFRPGHAPVDYLFRHYGQEALSKAVEHYVNTTLQPLIKEKGWDLAFTPHYKLDNSPQEVKADTLSDMTATVTCVLAPEIPEIDFATLSIPEYEVPLDEETVIQKLEVQAATYNTSIPLEEKRPAQKGDTLVYHLEYTDNQGHTKELEGAFQLGSGLFPEEFEKMMEGISEGHVLNERIRIPKDFPNPDLAGKKVAFKVAFSEIRQTVPHKADEQFAIAMGAKSLEDYRETFKTQLQQAIKSLAHRLSQRRLIEALEKMVTFPVPEMVVSESFQARWNAIQQEVTSLSKTDREKFFQDTFHQSEDEAKKSLEDKARAQIGLSFLIRHIAHSQSIRPTHQDIMGRLESIAARTRESLDHVVNYFRQNPKRLEQLQEEIVHDKVIAWILDQCQRPKESLPLEILEKEISTPSLA